MSTNSYDTMFDRLIAESENAAQAQQSVAPEGVEVEGKSYDDRITVTMKAGRVASIDLQPQATRLDNKTLGEEITKAVNAAIDANLDAVLHGTEEGAVDYASLTKRLQDIQGESIRQLDRYTNAMSDMLRHVKDLHQ